MASHLPKAIPALVTDYVVNAKKGEVILTMSNVDAHIAKSVEDEINRLNVSKPDSFVEFKNTDNNITLTIRNQDIPNLALNVARIMTRRGQMFFDGEQTNFIYAVPEDIQSVLENLQENTKTTNGKLAIENLISATKQIDRQH